MCGSLVGSHTDWSMPLVIPTSRGPSAWNTSCRPNPPSSVRNSSACLALTVTDQVRRGQAALEHVGAAVPLEAVVGVHLPRQADLGHHRRGEVTLVTRVVHREHGAHLLRHRAMGVRGAQVERRQGGVPVVRMEDRRAGDEARQHLEGGQHEEREAACAVLIVAVGIAIDAGAVIEVRMGDGVDLGARPGRP